MPTPTTASPETLLARQKAAFKAEMLPSLAVRLDRLARLRAYLEREGDRLAQCIAEDFGGRSRQEIMIAEALTIESGIQHARRHLKQWMKPKRVPTGLRYLPGRCELRPQPLGVVGIISPWNYPLLLALSPLVGVLAAGNRALIKPSELTPAFSEALKTGLAECFASEEVAVVTGDAELGKQFAALPFDHLVFTGSTAVGRLVAQAAAKNLTPVTLELGGKSPAIIDESCDLSAVIERLAWGKLLNAGQTCIAPDYALVPKAQTEAFVAAMQQAVHRLYPDCETNPDYTAIVSEKHHTRLLELVEDARKRGARVIELDPKRGTSRRMAPKLLLNVTPEMRVMQEEIFGPLLPVISYESLGEAIRHINRGERPLALYWFGRDKANRERVLNETLSGGVAINDTLLHLVQDGLPFGGVGASGTGHYHGEHGFVQFSKLKPVFYQSRLAAIRLFYPPYKPHLERLLRWVKWL